MEQRLDNYMRFFEDQVKENENEFRTYLSTPLRQLFHSDKAFYGKIVGVNDAQGHVILQFRKNHTPRLKIQKTFCLLRSAVWNGLGTKITEWNQTCKEFLEKKEFHTVFSDIVPLYFLKRTDADYDYLGCSSVSYELYAAIKKGLLEGKALIFTIFEGFPPVKYLVNMHNYIEAHQGDSNLMILPKIKYEDWNPIELTYTDNIPEKIIKTLNEDQCCVLQGPPGTGKSYTIAQIANQYLKEGKSVCVTTMSNKGLVEFASQPPLADILSKGHIKKTMLTADEASLLKGIQPADKDLLISKGDILCTTYYILSGKFKDKNQNCNPYDLLVIEEASQAYLVTIAAFMTLGKQCLIVGDPMQLPPIVLNENKPDYKSWNISTLVDGIKTLVLGKNVPSYRITTSFRLTSTSAALTGLFYNNTLVSVQKEPTDFSKISSPLFPKDGGTIITYSTNAKDSVCSEGALKTMNFIVDSISNNYPSRSIAIISPFRETIQHLQKQFYYETQDMDITVDTVDRIQGATVDYTIFYLPLRNIGFALSERRFNVATSRSRSTTLIISDIPLEGFSAIQGNIAQYLNNCQVLTENWEVVKQEQPNEILTQMRQSQGPNKVEVASDLDKPKVKVVGFIDPSKFERPKKEIIQGKDNLYVIDTNVFVNCPDIISKIDKQYSVILSAKVIDELDKLKISLDEQGRENVQKALRNINFALSERNLRMEVSDVSLLPADFYKKSPDNMILSVALKFQNENPIILTSDNGLQIKAKGLKIMTISLKDFLKRRI